MAPADALIYAAITRPLCNPPAQLQLFLHRTVLLRNRIQLCLHGIVLELEVLHLLLAGSERLLGQPVRIPMHEPCRIELLLLL